MQRRKSREFIEMSRVCNNRENEELSGVASELLILEILALKRRSSRRLLITLDREINTIH